MKKKINIFIFYKGGLGNQFFQYFFAMSLSAGYDSTIYFIKSPMSMINIKRKFTILDFKNIKSSNLLNTYKKIIKSILSLDFQFIIEKDQFKFQEYLLCKRNIFIFGYWQSFKYLKKINVNFDKKNFSKKFIKNHISKTLEIKILESNSVAVHFRRGFESESSKTLNYHGVLDLSYYKKSIDLILKKVSKAHFFLFSDDIDWLKKNSNDIIGTNISYSIIDIKNQSIEFYLMSICKHNIIANSSYSWWAAYFNNFNNKIIISPKKWLSNSTNFTDLIPHHWFQI